MEQNLVGGRYLERHLSEKENNNPMNLIIEKEGEEDDDDDDEMVVLVSAFTNVISNIQQRAHLIHQELESTRTTISNEQAKVTTLISDLEKLNEEVEKARLERSQLLQRFQIPEQKPHQNIAVDEYMKMETNYLNSYNQNSNASPPEPQVKKEMKKPKNDSCSNNNNVAIDKQSPLTFSHVRTPVRDDFFELRTKLKKCLMDEGGNGDTLGKLIHSLSSAKLGSNLRQTVIDVTEVISVVTVMKRPFHGNFREFSQQLAILEKKWPELHEFYVHFRDYDNQMRNKQRN